MKGFVYTIRSKSSALVYYGSTLQKMLSNRMAGHRSNYKALLAGKCKDGCTSFQILALGDAYIELVEEVEVESKQHLRALEGKYQRENECVNKNIAGRTPTEYRALPKAKAATAAYNATPKARAARAAHETTPTCKAYRAAYQKTPAAKAGKAAYEATPECKAYRVAYRAKRAVAATPERKAARAAYNAAAYQKRKALLNLNIA